MALVYNGSVYIIHKQSGAVVTDPKDDRYIGAEVESNNTGELSGQYKAHEYGVQGPIPEEVPGLVRYDSGYAQDIASGQYQAKTNRLLAAKTRGAYSKHHSHRRRVAEKHVRGHVDQRKNETEELNDIVDEVAKIGAGPKQRDRTWRLHPWPYHILAEAFPEVCWGEAPFRREEGEGRGGSAWVA